MEYTLIKKDEKKGKQQIWRATIQKEESTGTTTLSWTWGQMNGKMQNKERTYTEGKQKRDATQQAELECRKMMKDKMRKGYAFDSNSAKMIIEDDEEVIESATGIKVNAPHVMLAHNLEKYPEMYNTPEKGAYVMRKLDGLYAMAHVATGKLWSRQRVPFVGLPHIENAIRSLFSQVEGPKPTWIVGELYRHGMEFQKITGLVRRSKHHLDDKEILDIQYHVFDVMDSNNPFYKRYATLCKLIPKDTSVIKRVEAIYLPSLQQSYKNTHKKFTEEGYEGLMVHPDDGPGYQENKRTKWLLKYKTFQQEEYQCLDVLPLKHSDKKGEASAGSVLLVDSKGNEFCATPKFTEEEKKNLWIHRKDYIGQIATVQFFCLTDEKKVPRFPVLIGFRHPDDMS